MLAARMHGYKRPLVLEEVKVPLIAPDQILVRVGEAGMFRSDVQLIDGYFAEALRPTFPIARGHEIVGLVAVVCDQVPPPSQLAVGDQVVVASIQQQSSGESSPKSLHGST